MNTRRVAAIHRKLAELHRELAEELEGEGAPTPEEPKPARRAKAVAARERRAITDIDKARARRALERLGYEPKA